MEKNDDDQLEYAPATGLQAATTIHTTAHGLDASLVEIDVGDRFIRAYFARPATSNNAPLLLVLSEAFGLHEHIADIVRRFAHQGYFAIAPDLMVRQGDPMTFTNIGSLVSDLLLQIPDDQVMSDLDATVEWSGLAGADVSKVAATGFCWGGRWTWLYAAHMQMNAAVAWYGIVDGTVLFPKDDQLFPRHPLDLTNALKTPVLGLYGGQDEAIPIETIHAMERRLETGSSAARASHLHVYPDGPHAFFADYRDSYVPNIAHDAWKRCIDWLDVRMTAAR